jgi:hypothetical protein
MKSLSLDMVYGVRRAGPDKDCIIDLICGLELEGGVWAHCVIV